MDNSKYVLEENIYHGNSENNIEEIKQQLLSFSKELVERRRDIPEEGGLQAMMVISEDKFGAKVNEKDGEGSHRHSGILIMQFLNGDYNYYQPKVTNIIGRVKKEYYQQLDSIDIRILDGKDKIMFAIQSLKKETSNYQYQVLKTLLDIWSEIKETNIYKAIEVGIAIPEYKMEFCTDWDQKYTELDTIFNNKNK